MASVHSTLTIDRSRCEAAIGLSKSSFCFGSEAVGRLEVLSAKATATFSEPNLKLDEIRQLNPDYPEAPCATSKSAS